MHITILTLGSRGDVAPYAALGSGLQMDGHRVRLITFEDFEPLARRRGFEFSPIRGEMGRLLRSPVGMDLTGSGTSVIRMAVAILRMFRGLAGGMAQDLSDPRLRETDLLVNQLPGGLFGYDLAEEAGVPMVLAAAMPLAPTRSQPMLAFPRWLAFLPGYNLSTYWLGYQIAWGVFRSAIRHWRVNTLGLAPGAWFGVWPQIQESRFSVLCAFSPLLVARAPDWGTHVHLTGAWFDDDPAWQPPEVLVRFIESGPAPVFVGFGSMPVREPRRTLGNVLEGLKRVGARGVLQLGVGEPAPDSLPENVLAIGELPHNWLFPRMAAVVHHGGSGTTHTAVRAGVPSVLAPFVFDQFYWGRRVAQLGVGPKAIPFKELSAARLAGALDRALHDEGLRTRAETVGEAMRAEDGVRAASAIIERRLGAGTEKPVED